MRDVLPHAADEVIHRDRFVLRLSVAGSRPPSYPCPMAVTTTTVAETCAAAKRAARALASASTAAKNAALEATARLLEERTRARSSRPTRPTWPTSARRG